MALLSDEFSPQDPNRGSACASASPGASSPDERSRRCVRLSDLPEAKGDEVGRHTQAQVSEEATVKRSVSRLSFGDQDAAKAGWDDIPVCCHSLQSSRPSSARIVSKGGATGAFIMANNSTDMKDTTTIHRRAGKCLRSSVFETLVSIVVVLNIALVYLDTDARADFPGRHGEMEPPIWVSAAMHVIFAFFCLEFALRFSVEGKLYFVSWSNRLDIVIAIAGLAELIFLLLDLPEGLFGLNLLRIARLCRLLRLKRIFRLASGFAELNRLVQMMSGCFKTLFWSFLLLVMVMTVWSIVAVELINPYVQELSRAGQWSDCERCTRAFASVFMANLTFFQTVVAGDGWGHLAVPLIEAYPFLGIVLMGALMTLVFGVLNLIIAVIVDTFAESRLKDITRIAKEMDDYEVEEKHTLRGIFAKLDSDNDGFVSFPELPAGASKVPAPASWLRVLDIDEDDLRNFFEMIDMDGSGQISPDDFACAMYRMKHADPRTTAKFIKHMLADMDARYTSAVELMSSKLGQLEKALPTHKGRGPTSDWTLDLSADLSDNIAEAWQRLEEEKAAVQPVVDDVEQIRRSLEQALVTASACVVETVLSAIKPQAEYVSGVFGSPEQCMPHELAAGKEVQTGFSGRIDVDPEQSRPQNVCADSPACTQHSRIQKEEQQSAATGPSTSATRGPSLVSAASIRPDLPPGLADVPPRPHDSL